MGRRMLSNARDRVPPVYARRLEQWEQKSLLTQLTGIYRAATAQLERLNLEMAEQLRGMHATAKAAQMAAQMAVQAVCVRRGRGPEDFPPVAPIQPAPPPESGLGGAFSGVDHVD